MDQYGRINVERERFELAEIKQIELKTKSVVVICYQVKCVLLYLGECVCLWSI